MFTHKTVHYLISIHLTHKCRKTFASALATRRLSSYLLSCHFPVCCSSIRRRHCCTLHCSRSWCDEPFCFPNSRGETLSPQQMKSDKFQSRTNSTLHNNIDPLAFISFFWCSFILTNFPMPCRAGSQKVVFSLNAIFRMGSKQPFWYALYVSFFRSSPCVKMYNLVVSRDVKRSVQVHNNNGFLFCLYKDRKKVRVHCRGNRSVAHKNIIKDESFIASTART